MHLKQNFFRIGLVTVLLSFQFFIYASSAQAQTTSQATYIGHGVEASIRALLCAPSDASTATTQGTASSIPGTSSTATVTSNPAANDLPNCINRGYKFALAFGAVASVFFLVLAGYMYMVGADKGKQEAKEIITAVLVGFLIMLSSYVLLQQINPTLVAFRTIQPPQIQGTYGELPSCGDIKLGVGDDCTLVGGGLGVSNGNGTGIPPQGGTMTGTSGKVCSMGKDEDLNTHAKCQVESRLETAFQQAASSTGIDENFIKTIATIESHWKENAVSWTGCCLGLMQMAPATASRFGCTNNGWQTNGVVEIPCAAKYMKLLRDRYNANDYVKIAAGYNAGEGTVGPSPNCPGMIVALCPFKDAAQTTCIVGANTREQTRNYVVKMARIYKEYQQCGH